MKLEQQVVSLELAKKMKELGFEQESYFYWTQIHTWKSGEYKKDSKPYVAKLNKGDYSAYTVAELGEMLPRTIKSGWLVSYAKSLDGWIVLAGMQKFAEAETEADARAKMLIYLKENNLLETK